MSPFDDVIYEISRGIREGSNWIPVKYPSLKHHFGISKKLYHLVGGDPGTGKTSFVDGTYVLDAHDTVSEISNVKLKTVYLSMERSQTHKKAKWLAHRTYTKDGRLRSAPDLLTWGTARNPADERILKLAKSHEDYFTDLLEDVYIIDGANNPTGVYKILYKYALAHGTLYGRNAHGDYWKTTLESWQEKNRDDRRVLIEEGECPFHLRKHQRRYKQDDESIIMQVILDNIGKVKKERGFNDKEDIDKMSENLRSEESRVGS